MSRKQYRVEAVFPSKGKTKYFLVKDVKVRNKKRKVSKYLQCGTGPTPAEADEYRRRYAYEIELKAAKKKAEMSTSFYVPEFLPQEKLCDLEYLRYLYATFTELLTVNEADKYEKEFEIHYVSGTTSIEGNTLTLAQTRDLLENEILPENKSLREVNEVQNFKKVVKLRDKWKGKITLDFIKGLHSLIMDNIDIESAGAFRRTDGYIIGDCDLRICPASMIEVCLQETIDEYYRRLVAGKHPFEAAAIFHYSFEMIHPFTDGNGRVGREVFNYLLKKEKFPKLLFLGKDRQTYIAALKHGNVEEYSEMISTFAELILNQRMKILEEYLKKIVHPVKKKGQMRITDFSIC